MTVHVETAKVKASTPDDLRRAAYNAFLSRARARAVPSLPDESLRRESIYEA